jgi:hypothetical protein
VTACCVRCAKSLFRFRNSSKIEKYGNASLSPSRQSNVDKLLTVYRGYPCDKRSTTNSQLKAQDINSTRSSRTQPESRTPASINACGVDDRNNKKHDTPWYSAVQPPAPHTRQAHQRRCATCRRRTVTDTHTCVCVCVRRCRAKQELALATLKSLSLHAKRRRVE